MLERMDRWMERQLNVGTIPKNDYQVKMFRTEERIRHESSGSPFAGFKSGNPVTRALLARRQGETLRIPKCELLRSILKCDTFTTFEISVAKHGLSRQKAERTTLKWPGQY